MSQSKLAVVYSRGQQGLQSPLVTIETHLTGGLPKMCIVGLPEKAVQESKDRIRSAFLSSGLHFPQERVTINLAPADLPKEGGRFDLPIAIGILASSAQIPMEALNQYEFAGELALTGALRPIRGALPFSLATAKAKRQLFLPQANIKEAALASTLPLFSATHLLDVCAHLQGKKIITPYEHSLIPQAPTYTEDISDVKGQLHAKRALEIAAAGFHSLLLVGPPGTGKSLLASTLPTILPPMEESLALESAVLLSLAKKFKYTQWKQTPFRSPHHSASSAALVGGGNPPKPGEVSLAHGGVLYLDELPEFQRSVLESLREPLENRYIHIARANNHITFPANFQLIAAMNPCPCGHGLTYKRCQCAPDVVQKYRARVSGPLLDRIDIRVHMPQLPPEYFINDAYETTEKSEPVRMRVIKARKKQYDRQKKCNGLLSGKEVESVAQLDKKASLLLKDAFIKMELSPRSYHRIKKVARTIADLADVKAINEEHVAEALTLKTLS
ncbi:MAG: YifB family Mg chelatase-like AAA ATPase [Gammaproteobacteria bacterium]